MRPIDAHALPIAQTSNIFPDDLLIAKARPSVTAALLQERVEIPSSRCHEEGLSSIAIIEGNLPLRRVLLPGFRDEGGGGPIPGMLGVMSVEVANPIGGIVITIPTKILLDGSCGCSVRLGGHDRFVAHDARGGVLLFVAEEAV